MKLYATLKNQKGKIEGLGDNGVISIELSRGNKIVARIFFDGDGAIFQNVTTGKEYETIYINKGINQKGECKLGNIGLDYSGTYCYTHNKYHNL